MLFVFFVTTPFLRTILLHDLGHVKRHLGTNFFSSGSIVCGVIVIVVIAVVIAVDISSY